ncbi:MAG: hypothetical protein RMI94_10630 [Bryobacterales bacterium]|nr:hypothetical protein [Bryobacteraceae bacterium]MDW8130995.1 hypothetical protein [Bryobacterales bacterium]
MPAIEPSGGMRMVGSSLLMERNRFNARGLDIAYFVYFTLAGKMVTFQERHRTRTSGRRRCATTVCP